MSLAALRGFGQRLVRVKVMDSEEAQLSRCLNTSDLVALGAGVYVLAGAAARDNAGPAVVLSFAIAALASVLAGLCYAEFGARAPQTGSAYLYSYVAVGELWAFITGWNLILSYIIGNSSLARAWSSTFDEIFGKSIEEFSRRHMPMDAPRVLAGYPDLLAVLIIITLTGLLESGVKESAAVTKGFAGLNVLVLSVVIIGGFVKGNLKNWDVNPEEILNATSRNCSLKELLSRLLVKNGQRAVPVGTVAPLLVCFVAYLGVSAALTVMMPYYMLDKSSPLPVATHAVAVGSLCALSTCLLGSMLPLPRIIYAMARDGLLFKVLARVSRRRTPVVSTLVAGLMSAVMALLFDLKDLVDLMSIGTLLAYTMVATCVLVLRYQPKLTSASSDVTLTVEEAEAAAARLVADSETRFTARQLFFPVGTEASPLTGLVVNVCTGILGVLVCTLCVVASGGGSVSILCFILLLCLILTVVVHRQPQSRKKLPFKVPFLPFLPVISMFINVYLMTQLSRGTWIRFAIWMLLGFLIYFGYGVRNSSAASSCSDNVASCTRRDASVGSVESFPLTMRRNDRVEEAQL